MKAFIEPEAEIVEFNESDAIVASTYCPNNCKEVCKGECNSYCMPHCGTVG